MTYAFRLNGLGFPSSDARRELVEDMTETGQSHASRTLISVITHREARLSKSMRFIRRLPEKG